MRKEDVVAILCSDIHLSHTPPIARSAEPDWYEAMRRSLTQIKSLSHQLGRCPIICAGDIFDKWNSPPELINFALDFLEELECEMYSIPGNHDLPYHNYEDIHKSAYEALTFSPNFVDMNQSIRMQKARLDPFPPGREVVPSATKGKLQIAAVHDYIWENKRNSYPGAPLKNTTKAWAKKLKGYDVAIFGDNHIGFTSTWAKHPTVFNCGTLMRRTIAERQYQPQIGILFYDGSVLALELDCSSDLFLEDDTCSEILNIPNMQEFLEELSSIGAKGLDFVAAVEDFLKSTKVGNRIRKIILESLEEK